MAGWLAGGLLTGPLSDRFGRKTMMLSCHTIRCIGAYVCLYSPTYEGFAIGQVIMGITSPSATLALYIIVAEVTGRKWRAAFGVSWHILLFSFGGMIIPGVAYFVRDHFNLMAVFFWPLGLFFLLYLFVDESPRWLLARRREKEAVAILNHMAKVNKGPDARLPDDVHFKEEGICQETKAQKTGSPLDLFRTPNLRKKTCIIWLQWFTISLVYYGLSLNVGRLPGSVYLNSFLLSGVELPGYLTGIFLLERIGRKKTTGGSTMLAGFATILCIPFLLNSNLEDVATGLSIVGKGAAAAGFAAIYVYTAELYPTNIRNIALGSASMVARVSGMAAPFVGGQMVDVWSGLPSLCYGVLGLLSGALVFLLPETVGMKLPESIEEAEAFGKKNSRPNNTIYKMDVDESNGYLSEIEDKDDEECRNEDLLPVVEDKTIETAH
ncbi:hypothetical protein CAPTEDRAFT_153730 [Capitella teleta]|uniref:Major facilitator superfamily (MFS) profile domain-containing protein n=1 Tax=Capitella teleta TaxID=283909 RepID=R7UNU3_CAPTE|nr:hypothetical protein CAPTEDRAFT_153730 [Capitella teleta]|eukprot:ELU05582.1 hypothetical protein CAPTEDRAFT_153730 [Capitella teleta]